jgi:hypothetical protein
MISSSNISNEQYEEAEDPRRRSADESKTGSVSFLVRFFCAMVDELLFVLSYSPVQFIYQAIDCGVHIFFDVISIDRTTIYVNCGFGFVPEFFDCEDTAYVRHQIKMTFNFFDFGLDITSEGLGYLDVMA